MKIYTTSDGFKWTSVSELREELEGLQSILNEFNLFPFNIGICLRTLEKDTKSISKSRYYSKDNCLYIDIVVFEEDLMPIKRNLDAKRRVFGDEWYKYFFQIMKKYEKKFPILKQINPIFLSKVEIWLIQNKWIKSKLDDDVLIKYSIHS